MLRFNLKYFTLAFILFITEVLIALFVKDSIIRPYGGDFLVVIMLYFGVRAFIKTEPWKIGLYVLLFSYIIETLQYINIIDKIGLSQNIVVKTVLGYGFEWKDILAYTLGIAAVLLLDKDLSTSKKNNKPSINERQVP